MRSRVGAWSALKHKGRARSEGRGWGQADTFKRRIEQINKASQEGVEAGAGREGDVEKGQAGLRRSQLKMQVCRAWVFWNRGPKEGARLREERGEGTGGGGGKGSSALRRGGGWRPRKGSN